MAEALILSNTDRVLVLAPHPDDESIACGGLLLAAQDAGAARRVIVVTDGDNNPWPQRWVEKRWRIDARARARWGSRRRLEAQAALDVLGVDVDQRYFFGLPDSTLTDLLMRRDATLVSELRGQIEQFQPTRIALPVLEDRHPDHSALMIAARMALLGRAPDSVQLLGFSVHGKTAAADRIEVPMSASQEADKQRAILQHETQMRLSRSRFIVFAKGPEIYRRQLSLAPVRADHPLRCRIGSDRQLNLHLNLQKLHGAASDHHLLISIGSASGEILRWRVALPGPGSASCDVLEVGKGYAAMSATWQRGNGSMELNLPLPATMAARLGYVKLSRNRPGLVIYDRYGWQNIEFSAPEFGKN